MRFGLLALLLGVHITAVCQSGAPTASPAENQQRTDSGTSCSRLRTQILTPCFALLPNTPQPRATQDWLWNKVQLDATDPLHSDLPDFRIPQSLIAQNGPLLVDPQVISQWHRAKCVPIPTQWPNAKFENIPTQWPLAKIEPIDARSAAAHAPPANPR